MRKNTKVVFFNASKRYDPHQSEYIVSREAVGELWCNVTNLTRQKSLENYGEYIKKAKVIRLTNSIPFKFSSVEIDGESFELFDYIDANSRTSVVVRGVDM